MKRRNVKKYINETENGRRKCIEENIHRK